MTPLLNVQDVSFAYDCHPILQGISFTVHTHELVGVIGPNGSGKSTLLNLLLGLLPPAQGSITIAGTPIHSLRRKELAKLVSFVPQDTAVEAEFAVRDVVAMGRTPYLGRLQPETDTDAAAIAEALQATATQRFASRAITHLSGGERQRVVLAQVVAQQTPLIVLDEPTAHLDLVHQLDMLTLVKKLVRQGRGALVALHDLTLAVRFCDRVLVLVQGSIVADGQPARVITAEHLAAYFGVHARVWSDPETGCLIVLPLAPLGRS